LTDWNELLRELKKGKKKAQRRFFDLTTDRMMGVAVRYTKDRSGAKDCLQESYIRIFRNIDDFDYKSDEQLFAWINKIVSREALRWIKRNKKFFWTDDDLIISSNGSKKAPDYLFEDDLLNHLTKLPEAQRIVFNLYVIEGYSHKEIEEITGINEVTARSYLSRARKKLQDLINRKISIKK
jgi:RNA polymerase sigma factor (sigma-70 family)